MHPHRTWHLGWVLGAWIVLGSRLQAAGRGAWRNLGAAKGRWVSGQVGQNWDLRGKFWSH